MALASKHELPPDNRKICQIRLNDALTAGETFCVFKTNIKKI